MTARSCAIDKKSSYWMTSWSKVSLVHLAKKMEWYCSLIILLSCLGFVASLTEHDMTVIVPPGQRECFHQHMKEKQTLDFEYQVLEGGDLDINFILRSPTNKALATDARKEDAIHTFPLQETGEYLFCFDNSFSRMAQKIVFFDLIVDSEDEGEDPNEAEKQAYFDAYAAQEMYEIRIEEIEDVLSNVKENLFKSQSHQRTWRNIEFRDRYIAERNYERVGFWSVVSSVVMIGTFIIQVVMIRGLFGNTNKVVT